MLGKIPVEVIILYAQVSTLNPVPVLPLYRNQSIDLFGKSIDWFLYEGNNGT